MKEKKQVKWHEQQTAHSQKKKHDTAQMGPVLAENWSNISVQFLKSTTEKPQTCLWPCGNSVLRIKKLFIQHSRLGSYYKADIWYFSWSHGFLSSAKKKGDAQVAHHCTEKPTLMVSNTG